MLTVASIADVRREHTVVQQNGGWAISAMIDGGSSASEEICTNRVNFRDGLRRTSGVSTQRHSFLVVTMSHSSLDQGSIDRIVQMAWEDRTPFDAIQSQFGLTPGEVIKLMRSEMKPASFKLWRARTAGRKTKHVAQRGFVFGRFRCPDQKGS